MPPFQKVPGASSDAGPDQLLTPILAQELVEHLGVGLVLGGRALGNAFPVAAAQRLEGGLILGLHQRLQLFPRLVGGREQLIGLGGGAQEALDGRLMLLGPALAEDVADHGDLALGAKLRHHVLDADQLFEALRLEPRRIRPEIEHGIDRALLGALGQERRGAELLRRLGAQVEIGGAQRIGHHEQPTLVDAGHRPRRSSCP